MSVSSVRRNVGTTADGEPAAVNAVTTVVRGVSGDGNLLIDRTGNGYNPFSRELLAP